MIRTKEEDSQKFVKHSVAPVSYTHLDVYKRQGCNQIRSVGLFRDCVIAIRSSVYDHICTSAAIESVARIGKKWRFALEVGSGEHDTAIV